MKDAQTWTGLTRLREVFDRLELVKLADEDGRELFDRPDAPRPDPETPAPVRLLYDFDNLHLSYAERTRFSTPETAAARAQTFGKNGVLPGTILVDGEIRGVWTLARDRAEATLTVRPLVPWTDAEAESIAAEAAVMAEWAGASLRVSERPPPPAAS